MRIRLVTNEIVCNVTWFHCLGFLQPSIVSKACNHALQLACKGLVCVSNEALASLRVYVLEVRGFPVRIVACQGSGFE